LLGETVPDRRERTRLRPVLTVMAAAVLAVAVVGGVSAGQARAAAGQAAGPPVGPVPVTPLGHQGLCWQAGGNGSPITLEDCAAGVNGQLWTFTSDGVLMNGNGYCLQDGGPGGTPAGAGSQAGDSLFLSFSGQCGGAASQLWTFSATTNQIRNAPGDLCTDVQGGALVPGAAIVPLRCTGPASSGAASGVRWSQGASDLKLSAPSPAAGTQAQRPAGTRREFTAELTVSNGAKATTAYGAFVSVQPRHGLTVTKMAGSGGLSGWTCAAAALKCEGNLAAGATGRVTLGGTVTGAASTGSTVTAHAGVLHTGQSRHAALSATVPLRMSAVPPAAAAAPGNAPRGPLTSGAVILGLAVAGLLVALGIFLAFITRRRQQAPVPTLAGPAQPE
jgi:Ricin-type beta-trefoil lectin domain